MRKTIVLVLALAAAFTIGSIGTVQYLKFKRAATEVECQSASPEHDKELSISYGYKNGKPTKLHCYLK